MENFLDPGEAYYEKLCGVIERRGWALIPGLAVDGGAYTVGLTELNHPELIILGGFEFRSVLRVLHVAAKRVKEEGYRWVDGLHQYLIEDSPTPARLWREPAARDKAKLCSFRYLVVPRLLGTPEIGFALVQLFFPDPVGRFPWEPGCQADYQRQLAPASCYQGPVPERSVLH